MRVQMSAVLYLVRHGEALPGADTDDLGLSQVGRDQVAALGRRLRAQQFGKLLHGPRRRASETAAILSTTLHGVTVEQTALVEDRTPVPSPERRSDYPADRLPWLDETAPAEQDLDGTTLSEAITALARRAHECASVGPLLAVTHGFVIGWFVRAALEAPTHRWLGLNSAYTGLTVIDYQPTPARLITFNDTGHLHPPPNIV